MHGEFSDGNLPQSVPYGKGLPLGELLGVVGQCGVDGDIYGDLEEFTVDAVVYDVGINSAVVVAGIPIDEAYRSVRQADFVDGDAFVPVVCDDLYGNRRVAGCTGVRSHSGDGSRSQLAMVFEISGR